MPEAKETGPKTNLAKDTPVVEGKDLTTAQGSATDVGIHHTPKANNAQPLE